MLYLNTKTDKSKPKNRPLSKQPKRKANALNDSKNIKFNEKIVEKPNGEQITLWSYFVTTNMVQLQDDYPPFPSTCVDLYLYNEILDVELYTEVFHLLRNLEKPDELHIYINSPGGSVNTTASFLAVISELPCIIVTHIDGVAASAAFILALTGDYIEIGPYSSLMAHNFSLSTFHTDGANLSKYLDSMKATYREMLFEYGTKILSEEEIKGILDHGHELHLTAKEAKTRFEAYIYRKKKEAEAKTKVKRKTIKKKLCSTDLPPEQEDALVNDLVEAD